MIKNVIFGKQSRITDAIAKNLKNVEIISANNLDLKKLKNKYKKKTNFIFNNFYPSFKLNQLNTDDYQKFAELSVLSLIKILSNLSSKHINKIIYTSSASVYNLTDSLMDTNIDAYNRKLYASFKISAEKVIQNFCQTKNIKFYIMRIFNTYGDHKDQFSFIEKLITIKRKNLSLKLINNGISLRDFIHLTDVAEIYKKFLINQYEPGVYDVGTGNGVLIKNLVDFLEFNKNKIINKNNISQMNKSIANTEKLKKSIGNYEFKSVEKYLKHKIKIKRYKKLNLTKIDYPNSRYEGSVIYGAGYAGKRLYMNLQEQKEKVIYFIDDDPKKHNTLFLGIPVISFDNLKKINKKKIVDKIFIAIPSLNENQIKKLNKKLSLFFFDVRYLPEKKLLINNQINLNDLEVDQVNSLLERKPIKRKKILSLKNKNVLVTGAGGTIGSEICRQLIFQDAKKIIGVDNSELAIYQKNNTINKKIKLLLCDVNNQSLLKRIINDNKINLIIHAAAYKHVNILECNISAAVKNNIFSTYNICNLAKKYSCKMIFISTDKAANPISILGYTKRVAEKICEHYNKQVGKKNLINIVRFGNVFGSSGSAITNFIEQINSNQSLKITHPKASRYFMTILEACYLVLLTTSIKPDNKIFVLNMGKPLNILRLAQKLGKLKSKINSNYKFRYQITGLNPGEKLHENLVDKNEIKSKLNKEIFFVKSKFNKKLNFNTYFEKLVFLYKKQQKNKLLKQLMKIKNM